MSMNNLQKYSGYLVTALILGLILKYMPNSNVSDRNIGIIALLAFVSLVVVDLLLAGGASNNASEQEVSNGDMVAEGGISERVVVDEEGNIVATNNGSDVGNDVVRTGVAHNKFKRTQSRFENGEFTGFQMPFSEVRRVLEAQRYNSDVNASKYYSLDTIDAKGLTNPQIKKAINASRLNDLYNQHNFHIKWSPHTHIGKARGHLNWDNTVAQV